MRKLLLPLAVLLALTACNSQPQTSTEKTPLPDTVSVPEKQNVPATLPTVQLLAEPTTLSMAQLPQMVIGVKVWNRTEKALDPQLHMFQLEVNGAKSMAFSLAASNGTREAKWYDLPAGDSAEFTWPTLALSIFQQPGDYKLQLKTPMGDAEAVLVSLRQ
ncbi:MAG: hypothetical protein U0176_13230 [Bacteroidia bacterium]